MSNLNRCILLVVLLLLAPIAVAETESDDASDEETSEFVEYVEVKDSSLPKSNTIATKLALPLQLTPAHVGTVGAPLLYEQHALVLGDALRNISGLNIADGSGVHDYFTIRGFDSVSSGLVMTDGAAEPEVSYYRMYNVQGVEVFKGPAGFLYGKNPLAGAVNIVRKQPLPADFAAFGGSFGSYDTLGNSIDWNESSESGQVSFRLNGLWSESDGYRDETDHTHWAVNPSLTFQPNDATKMTFNMEYVDAEYSPDSGLPLVDGRIADVPRRRSYQGSGDFSDQKLNRFQFDFETRLNDKVTLRNKAYYRSLDWDTSGTLLRGTAQGLPWLAPGQVQVIRDVAELADEQQFFGAQFEAVISLTGGRVEHQLLAGIEIKYESDEFEFDVAPQADVDLALNETVVDLGSASTRSSVGDADNLVAAVYIVDQMKLTPKFELLLGARYDYVDTDGDVVSLLDPFGTEVSYSRDDSEVSPMIGAVFAPDDSLSIYANAARSYAPPSTRLVDEFDPSSRDPEQGTQYELGVKKRLLDGKLRTTFAVYQLEREDIAIADQNFFTQQSGDQRSRGFELELAAEPRPGLRTFFSYAYTDAELVDFAPCVPDGSPSGCTIQNFSGNTPIMAPENVANAWVSKSFGNGWGVAGGVRYIDEQFIFENNAFAIDDALTLDGSVFYDFSQWRFKVNLKNLTDEEYETRGIAGDASVIPADPFSVFASVEFRL